MQWLIIVLLPGFLWAQDELSRKIGTELIKQGTHKLQLSHIASEAAINPKMPSALRRDALRLAKQYAAESAKLFARAQSYWGSASWMAVALILTLTATEAGASDMVHLDPQAAIADALSTPEGIAYWKNKGFEPADAKDVSAGESISPALWRLHQ